MTDDLLLGRPGAVPALAEKLKRLSYIDRAHTPFDEPPSWTLAIGLEHIEGSCREYGDQLRALLRAEAPDEIEDALVQIREELRHVVWHLTSTPYFRDVILSALADEEEPTS
jgi:hypothetical protein